MCTIFVRASRKLTSRSPSASFARVKRGKSDFSYRLVVYLSLRPDDAIIRVRLRELASVRRRFGYRSLLLMIRSEGVLINRNRHEAPTSRS